MSVNDIIEYVLSADKTARTDDNYLYGRVIEQMAKQTGNYNGFVQCFVKVMTEYNLPSIHTIVRARRYIQKAEPELIDKETERRRFKSEAVFRERYKNG